MSSLAGNLWGPLCTGWQVDATTPCSGAVAMQPIMGRRGTERRSLMRTTPWSRSIGSCLTACCVMRSPSGPKPGILTLHDLVISTERISILSVSPGCAPSIASGPVTAFTFSMPICSSVSPRDSRSYASSPVSNVTTDPDATVAAIACAAESENTVCSLAVRMCVMD